MKLSLFQGGYANISNLDLLGRVLKAECSHGWSKTDSGVISELGLQDQGKFGMDAVAAVKASMIAGRLTGMSKLVSFEGKPDLVVFPELFLTGYTNGAECAEVKSGPSFQKISLMCKEYNVGVLYGYVEVDASRYYNSIMFIDKTGVPLANYRKVHLFSEYEKKYFTPGDGFLPPFSFMGLKIGIMICFDVEFPESVRLMAMQGASVILVPTANTNPIQNLIMVPSRAAVRLLCQSCGYRVLCRSW